MDTDELDDAVVIQDKRGAGYEAWESGKLVAESDDWDELIVQIRERMEVEKYWPDLYYVNERGAVDLLDGDGNVVESAGAEDDYDEDDED